MQTEKQENMRGVSEIAHEKQKCEQSNIILSSLFFLSDITASSEELPAAKGAELIVTLTWQAPRESFIRSEECREDDDKLDRCVYKKNK